MVRRSLATSLTMVESRQNQRWHFWGIFCNSRTKSTKSATSTTVDHTCSCDSTQARWTLARPVCINDSMVGLSPGNDFTAMDEYSTRRWAMRRQSGRTAATSECSRTLSSGLCEGRPSRRGDTSPADWTCLRQAMVVRFLVDGDHYGSPHFPDCSRKMPLPMHVLDQDNFTNTDDASFTITSRNLVWRI